MEAINKLLIGLVALTVIVGGLTCGFIVKEFVNKNKENNIIKSDKELTTIHPYNTCIKLFIDQADKKDAECDFEKAKSVCFDLIDKKVE